jgi:hypothetical protein
MEFTAGSCGCCSADLVCNVYRRYGAGDEPLFPGCGYFNCFNCQNCNLSWNPHCKNDQKEMVAGVYTFFRIYCPAIYYSMLLRDIDSLHLYRVHNCNRTLALKFQKTFAGEIPYFFRNAELKCCIEEYPSSKAISVIDFLFSSNSIFAICMRTSERYSKTV